MTDTEIAESPELMAQAVVMPAYPVVPGDLVGYAEEGPDGRLRAQVRIRADEFRWDPATIVMPHGGDLELEVVNDDLNTHCALLPSNGDNQFLWLPNQSRGRARLALDGPGRYPFSSIIGNDEGLGLVGSIVVLGAVPPEARLDRPAQPSA